MLAETEWCASDAEENNRTRSNSEKSDSDTSHVEEIVEHDSDEDYEPYDENDILSPDAVRRRSQDDSYDPIRSEGLRKRKKRSEFPHINGADSTPAETCYALKVEEEFAHVNNFTKPWDLCFESRDLN